MGKGILLFYHFELIAETPTECEWQRAAASRLGLQGRLRVAPSGLNGVLSGPTAALESYTAEVAMHFVNGSSIDWKLSPARSSDMFDSLSVRAVSELVSLGVPDAAAPLDKVGRHVTPLEFHEIISGAANSATPDVVLLDVRNVYEWRIGRFQAENVPTLLPPLRQFSELPSWLGSQLDAMRGRTVLMYCTGGVRCEAASAFLRHTHGDAGIHDVLQLEGGIERYLQAFPSDGGHL